MCGLAGFVRHPKGKGFDVARSVMTRVVEGVEHRGRHATGFAALGGSDPFIFKIAMPIGDLVRNARWGAETEKIRPDTTTVIAHTRWATLPNAHVDSAAHPFAHGRTVGAHNGMIYNWREIARRFPKEDTQDWQVDSEAAIYLLDRMDDPRAALAQLDGNWALSWSKDEKIHFARNTNPLWFAYVGTMRALFWCSERTPLLRALQENGVEMRAIDLYEPNAYTIYSYDPASFTDKESHVKRVQLPKPKKLKTSLAAWTGKAVNATLWDNWKKDDGDDKRGDETYNEWLARTGRDVTDVPYATKGKKSEPTLAKLLNDLQDAVAAQNKTIEKLVGTVQTQEAEIEYLFQICDAAGLLGGEPANALDEAGPFPDTCDVPNF